TSKMVKWLVDHPVNCIVLFSEDKSAPRPEGHASGRTKLEICAVITELVFKDDEDFAPLLKKGYCKQAVKFMQTGNGIVPDLEGHKFPWYSDLHSLWGGIPSYTPKTVATSTPGASQGTQLLALIQKRTRPMLLLHLSLPLLIILLLPLLMYKPPLLHHPLPHLIPLPSPKPLSIASPAAGLPPVEHQDKGKEHVTDPPSEDEMPEPPHDVDMDEDNFGGPDYPAEGDTDMDLGYA
ncbi:hypothetical protein PAXRUDRAFT_162950, partial [Paxillus rubicundulus Ve08.2h10]